MNFYGAVLSFSMCAMLRMPLRYSTITKNMMGSDNNRISLRILVVTQCDRANDLTVLHSCIRASVTEEKSSTLLYHYTGALGLPFRPLNSERDVYCTVLDPAVRYRTCTVRVL